MISKFLQILRSLEHFFLTVGQNNFGNKIPFRGPFLTEKHNSLKIPAIVRSCLLVHHSQHWERCPLEDLKIGYLPEMVMAH